MDVSSNVGDIRPAPSKRESEHPPAKQLVGLGKFQYGATLGPECQIVRLTDVAHRFAHVTAIRQSLLALGAPCAKTR